MMKRFQENSIIKVLIMIIFVASLIFIAIKCFFFFWEQFKTEENDKTITNVLTIQGKVKTIKGKATAQKDDSLFLGIKISEIDNFKIKNKLKLLKFNEDEFDKFYLLNDEHFKLLNIDINENDSYVVNYDKSEVIYIHGFLYKGRLTYKASDIKINDDGNKNIFVLNK